MKKISLAIPVMNEEDSIAEVVRRCDAMERDAFEIIELVFVDDGSTDTTLERLRAAATHDPRIKVISFTRNFGHQIAVSAALEHVSGDATVVIDGDLQDPPEFIPIMVKKWREGFDIVYAVRKKRNEGFAKKFFAAAFYRLLRQLADVDIPLDTGDFALMDKKVISMLRRMPERSRYLRGLRAWTGFKSVGIEYERDARAAGESKYTIRKMFDLAISGIIGFSTVPLRIAMYLGLVTVLVSGIGCLVVFIRWLAGDSTLVHGWASIIFIVSFLSGIQLMILGMMSEYIGRIYREVQARPLYIVKETIGLK